MKINIFFSIATKPGKFGSIIYNGIYKYYKINNIYIPLKIEKLIDFFQILNVVSVKGFSVSMPFKETIIKHLDFLDPDAKKIGSVNTVKIVNGKLRGYNSDYKGFKKLIKEQNFKKKINILILGSGGVARSVIYAFKKIGLKNLYINSRNKIKSKKLKKEFNINLLDNLLDNNLYFDVIINATPIGMSPKIDQSPINFSMINQKSVIFDFVASPYKTKLIKYCLKNNIKNFNGLEITSYQFIEQFKIYNNFYPSLAELKRQIKLFERSK